MHSSLFITVLATASVSALPLQLNKLPVYPPLPRGLDVDASKIPIVNRVSENVDKLPIDISVNAPLIPEKLRHRTSESESDSPLDIKVSDVPLVGDVVSDTVDELPVDISVSAPIVPEKRSPEAAVEVDLGGGGLSVKPRAVEVDLGGGGLSVKRRAAEPAVEVDLGGGGLSV